MIVVVVMTYSCSKFGISAGIEKARDLWLRHQHSIKEVVEGKERIGSEFIAAAKFFEETIGFHIRFTGDFIGLVPTRETVEDLKSLNEWFEKNGDRLSWDEKSQRVVVLPSA